MKKIYVQSADGEWREVANDYILKDGERMRMQILDSAAPLPGQTPAEAAEAAYQAGKAAHNAWRNDAPQQAAPRIDLTMPAHIRAAADLNAWRTEQ